MDYEVFKAIVTDGGGFEKISRLVLITPSCLIMVLESQTL